MSKSHLWRYAKEYKLCDHFFAAAFGGSFLNHQWLIAGRTPFVGTSSPLKRYVVASNGDVIEDGVITPDGYVVNTVQPYYPPFHHKATDETKRLPIQTHQTIGDALTQKNISWAWYSGGWDEAKIGNGKDIHYQYHHNPFLYFQNYAPNTQGREHLKDQKDFFNDIAQGKLPSVSFLKPSSHTNQHPGYATLKDADNELDTIIKAIQAHKALWSKTVIIITYDENGGLWDHVAPPKGDRFGPSTRIPALVISPLTRNKGVDHTPYDTTSILRFIEWRYDLPYVGDKREFPKIKL
jgi:phospholipase C